MIRKILLSLAAAGVVALTGCQTLPQSVPQGYAAGAHERDMMRHHQPEQDAPLVGPHWVLMGINGQPIVDRNSTPHVDLSTLPFVEFTADQHIVGRGTCNRLMGNYSIPTAGVITVQLASTRMACNDPTDLEGRVNAALGTATHFEIHGRMLRLLDASNQPVLGFRAMNPSKMNHERGDRRDALPGHARNDVYATAPGYSNTAPSYQLPGYPAMQTTMPAPRY